VHDTHILTDVHSLSAVHSNHKRCTSQSGTKPCTLQLSAQASNSPFIGFQAPQFQSFRTPQMKQLSALWANCHVCRLQPSIMLQLQQRLTATSDQCV